MLSVVNNVASVNAQNNLYKSAGALSKSLERLSSGLRINRAADDAAGLAISEGLRAQVSGLNQAVRNANDGISMIATAESAIVETTSILQRIRELAVQASSDTYSGSNRQTIQNEIDQLTSEITRIGNTVQFNGEKLLDGNYSSRTLQIGAMAGQTLQLSISDMRATAIGKIAEEEGTAVTTNALASGDLEIGGDTIGATASDGLSTEFASASALAKATAINAGWSNGTAEATTEHENSTAVGAATIGDGDFKINDVSIGAVSVSADDSDGALVDAINAVSSQTGVVASLSADDELVLTASDGRNITMEVASDNLAQSVGFAAGQQGATFTGTVTLTSHEAFSISGDNVDYAGFTAKNVSLGSDALNKIDVTTASKAADAIVAVDAAITQVSAQRSELGGLTNRLESTISNLRTVSENLASSESRIRDADFAAETAALTKNQILQQAGVAILAQANMTPQAALALLG